MTRASRRVNPIVGALFFSIFAFAGLFFTAALVWGFYAAASVWTWEEVECVIESSEVLDRGAGDDRYELRVRYRYEVDGRVYSGDSVDLNYSGSSGPTPARRLADRYAPGNVTTCRVDRADPTRSHLRRPSLWFGFAILLPLVFVAVGVGGIWFTWRSAAKQKRSEGARALLEPAERPISLRVGRPKLSWALFSWVFFLAGAGFATFFVLPAIEVVASRDWDEVPCEILESGVASHAGDDGTTYSVEVLYRYEIDGRQYQSNRYQFMGGSSSGHASKQEAVDRLPPGTVTTCYVDPDDPYEAVIRRDFSWEFLFALLPLVFMAIGAPGVLLSIGRALKRVTGVVAPPVEIEQPEGFRTLEAAGEEEEAYDDSPYRPSNSPLELEPELGPVGKLGALLLFNLAWNGLVGIFLWILYDGWRSGDFQGCLAVFLIPFVLIGLALLLGIPYQILALLNPRPLLTLTPETPRLGGSARVQWRFRGAAGRLSGLEMKLEGKEVARSGGGKSSRTSTEVFHAADLVQPGSLLDFRQGSATIAIPPDVMHSFDGGNNRVVWTLKLQGRIRFWPDTLDEFEIRVVPGARSEF